MKKGKSAKLEREQAVLRGLIRLFIEGGQPIGSNTLKENGFDHLSSATIRNYYAKLEEGGFLKQLHSSGGRTPTAFGLKSYAAFHAHTTDIKPEDRLFLEGRIESESQEVVKMLSGSLQALSEITGLAVLLSAPRFDHDQIRDVKLVKIDDEQLLVVIITDFGLIRTETLFLERRFSYLSLKRIETQLKCKIHRQECEALMDDEEELLSHLFHEVLLRHIVNYANFSSRDIYRMGFSQLLKFEELNDARALGSSLSLFENPTLLSHLITETIERDELTFFIGSEDLSSFTNDEVDAALICIPYRIQGKSAGVITLLGPSRVDYPRLFGLLRNFSGLLSQSLTKSTHAFKISFRQPNQEVMDVKVDHLIEDKRQYHE
ncbi:MAG: heat-inducible transcriptional repressor HrcA [Simkaniaceae bacterium]